MMSTSQAEEIDANAGPASHLATPELKEFFARGELLLADLESMGHCIDITLPRLTECRIQGYADWHALALCTHIAQLLGSRVMAKYFSWCAGTNAQSCVEVNEQILCLCSRMAGGDLRLAAASHFLREPGAHGYYFATRLGIEAYWRGDIDMLERAAERIRTVPQDRVACVPVEPPTDMLFLECCRDKLVDGLVNLPALFLHISQLPETIQPVYKQAATSLFLGPEDSQTVGLFTQGFDLLGSVNEDPAESGNAPGQDAAQDTDKGGHWFPE